MRDRPRVERCNTDLTSARPGAASLPKAASDRERPRVTDCDGLLSHSSGGQPAGPVTPPAPRRGIRYVRYAAFIDPDIKPIPPDPPIPPEPPVPVVYWNEEILIISECSGDQLKNSVAFLIPANLFSSQVSVADANWIATNYYTVTDPVLDGQLNCSTVACAAVAGSDFEEVMTFTEICSGGYWFSEPIPGLDDDIIVNTHYNA